MGTPAFHIPKRITAKTFDELTRKLLKIQAVEGGRVSIVQYGQDLNTKEHYYVYYPIKDFTGSTL